MKIGLVGASGRVGNEIINIISSNHVSSDDTEISIAAGYSSTRNRFDYYHTDSLDELIDISDAIVDFSGPELMKELLNKLINNPKPLVSGTTGHDNFNLLEELSKKVSILWSANMSIGINLFLSFSERYAKLLKEFGEFDISIFEMHHKNKKDSPSGTAISMKKVINKQLPDKNIDILSLRAGNIFGTHSLSFISSDEIIKLEHSALNRSIFAKGAILALKKLVKMPVGLYSMQGLFSL